MAVLSQAQSPASTTTEPPVAAKPPAAAQPTESGAASKFSQLHSQAAGSARLRSQSARGGGGTHGAAEPSTAAIATVACLGLGCATHAAAAAES